MYNHNKYTKKKITEDNYKESQEIKTMHDNGDITPWFYFEISTSGNKRYLQIVFKDLDGNDTTTMSTIGSKFEKLQGSKKYYIDKLKLI